MGSLLRWVAGAERSEANCAGESESTGCATPMWFAHGGRRHKRYCWLDPYKPRVFVGHRGQSCTFPAGRLTVAKCEPRVKLYSRQYAQTSMEHEDYSLWT
jgi:hypothetical protein